jgi:hypothetical protein
MDIPALFDTEPGWAISHCVLDELTTPHRSRIKRLDSHLTRDSFGETARARGQMAEIQEVHGPRVGQDGVAPTPARPASLPRPN